MTCTACLSAESDPMSGLYQANCDECKARIIANGRELFEASKAGKITPEYEEVLKRMFGDEWRAAHLRVKAWKERLKGQA
jgi:hypothetical protein